jgi:hypothetical protein
MDESVSYQAKIYIGTSGWSYPKGEGTWKGYFYPKGKINELEYYSQFFNTVEINSSFYRPPNPGYVYNWARSVPKDFLFAAKLTRPEKNVVCITGDGAFQMYMKELPTAAQYKLGCTWVILNNSALGWAKALQEEIVGWDTATFKVQPNFVKWAEACKCHGRRIERPFEIKPVMEEALEVNREGIPAVIDIVTGIDMAHFERAK